MELKNIDIEVWTKDTFPRNCPVVTTYTIETVLIMTISTRGYGQTDQPTDRPTDRPTLLPIELLLQLKNTIE